MTLLIRHPAELRALCSKARLQGKRVGFIPTMGALHAGHESLMQAARIHGADWTVVSIFVNPLQFGPNEDFTRYPRNLDADLERCKLNAVDVVFAPESDVMYPPTHTTRIEVTGTLTSTFEASIRPGHFSGVVTVVSMLFNIVGECTAVFGKKDYQQLRVIEQLVADLQLPVKILPVPTLRDADGLAMSSRNVYLSQDERSRARALPRALQSIQRNLFPMQPQAQALEEAARCVVENAFDAVDYIAIVDRQSFMQLDGLVVTPSVLVAAARIGKTRLIDNVELIP